MSISQVLRKAGIVHVNGKPMQEYSVEDGCGNLVATAAQKTSDGNIHQVFWYGGELHGKIELIDGGIEGLMEFIGDKLATARA